MNIKGTCIFILLITVVHIFWGCGHKPTKYHLDCHQDKLQNVPVGYKELAHRVCNFRDSLLSLNRKNDVDVVLDSLGKIERFNVGIVYDSTNKSSWGNYNEGYQTFYSGRSNINFEFVKNSKRIVKHILNDVICGYAWDFVLIEQVIAVNNHAKNYVVVLSPKDSIGYTFEPESKYDVAPSISDFY
jgi:hypothetical protein